MFDIREAQKFAWGVHVPEGNSDQTSGHARSGDLHGVGVGASSTGFGGDLVWDFLFVTGFLEHLEDDGVDVCATSD